METIKGIHINRLNIDEITREEFNNELEKLYERLENDALDADLLVNCLPNFYYTSENDIDYVSFFGRFVEFSFVFCFDVHKSEHDLINKLVTAIELNKSSEKYIKFKNTPSIWNDCYNFPKLRKA